jgi:hypothetical protein
MYSRNDWDHAISLVLLDVVPASALLGRCGR